MPQSNIELVKSLPFFAKIKEKDLEEILKNSRINHYKKGSLLFLEGERAMRFYIVIKGWVKLFNGNDEGKESIIQMIGQGKAIVETAILLNSAFPVSAKITEDAEILSIPATIIRECIKDNTELASNMLASLANQSKELMHQLGRLTLKTAQQRVGWFLLDLFLENGEKKTEINLPYDKSLIASRLGMKPETLSRVLQFLKEEGEVTTQKDVITLSDTFALCSYCDIETASKCKRHNSQECPNPDIVE